MADRCSPNDCCTAGVPGATKSDSAGPVSAARNTEPLHHPEQAFYDRAQFEQPSPHAVEMVARLRERRVASCRNCGNDPAAITRAFQAGVLAAYWDTYRENVEIVQARERREAERQAVNRWHE